tara:strand:+ start:1423 stop:1641 length:219 start_codon:yes stop_codon:yes gene_type:complete
MSKERVLLQRLVDSGVLGGYSFIAEVKELLAQPEQDLKLEWYQRGYKQGFVDGQDIPQNRLNYFTELLFEDR